MDKNFKVLLVGNTAWSMYNFRLGIAKALKSEGYEVIIAAPKDHTEVLIKEEGFKFVELTIDNKGVSVINDLLLIKNLYKVYKNLQPNLIIHYTIKPNIYGTLAARLAQIKSIAFVTGLGSMFIKKSLITSIIELMYRFAFVFSSEVWFLNKEDRNYFIQKKMVSDIKTEIFPGEGINTTEFVNNDSVISQNRDHICFLFLGRILKDKGIYEYVNAARIIKEKHRNTSFKILGFIDSLNPSAISQEEVDQWVREGIIEYLGQTSNVKPYVSAADCIVLPSYREGISRTLLEAASMEKPIITTNVTGCKDVVDDHVTGYLCKVQDSVDLALQMDKFIQLPDKAKKNMGLSGRKKVEREFDEKIVIQKYKKVLVKLV